MVVVASRIWLRRNALGFKGVFAHPDTVFAEAASFLAEFKRCNKQDPYLLLEGENAPRST